VGAAHVALGIAAQHSCDLGDARCAFEHHDVGGGDATARALAHENVVMRARGDLREVSDREDLMVRRDPTHRLTDLESDAATNTCVDLVEDEGGYVIEPGEYRLERKHDARQLAAGCDARQRTLLVADVQRDAELDRLRAIRSDVTQRNERRVKASVRHTEIRKHFVDRTPQSFRGLCAQRAERGAALL